MTCSLEYRHLSTSRLARLAARLGRAFVSPSTWWQVNSNFDTHVTSQLIQQAAKGIGIAPQVVMDSGIENVNQTVDKLRTNDRITSNEFPKTLLSKHNITKTEI